LERTLVLIKPDGVQRSLIGEIIGRFEARGLRIAGLKMIQISVDLASKHYAVHLGKPFYDRLIRFITSGPVVAMVLEGPAAIEAVRQTLGATNPLQATLGTIRADLGQTIDFNLVHGSDGPETARAEIALYFRDDELLSYARDGDRWVFP